ncbi:MAG: hypothetical protein HYV93_11800 [Candidatus Rokubacteria bacterium]|nr:hypothetical protein [Candidatus Rokubacteria bacterium]
MSPAWAVEFHENSDAGCPVREFLDALDRPRRAKIVVAVGLLAERGPTLPFPYSSWSEIPEGDVRVAEGRMKRYLEQRQSG